MSSVGLTFASMDSGVVRAFTRLTWVPHMSVAGLSRLYMGATRAPDELLGETELFSGFRRVPQTRRSLCLSRAIARLALRLPPPLS